MYKQKIETKNGNCRNIYVLIGLVLGLCIFSIDSQAQDVIKVDANYKPCVSTGINQQAIVRASNVFQIVPNPSNGNFSIQFLEQSNPITGISSIEIFDLLGQRIFNKTQIVGLDKSSPNIPISMLEIPNGVYVLKLSLETGIVHCQKIIIE